MKLSDDVVSGMPRDQVRELEAQALYSRVLVVENQLDLVDLLLDAIELLVG